MTNRALPGLTAVLALACALTAAPVQAASAKAATKQPTHSVKFIKNPNQETPAERERRFKRECKGMPNAGACLGYAS